MLQKYLNGNLLNVTDDDDHRKLSKASDDFTKKLVKNKAKIALFTLIAIDPDINPENPAVIEVRELIIKHWTTFSANAKDTALVFIRAVILESLKSLLETDGFAEIIWFASRNIIKYRKLTGKEREVIFEFLSEIGKSLNQAAIDSWAIDSEISTAEQIELKNIDRYLINDDSLTKYLEDSAGPTGKSGTANFASPNPYWSNQQTSWSHEFAPRASKAIKNSVDLSLKAIGDVVNENNIIIQSALNSDKFVQSDKDRQRVLALRSQLLWWKEAAFSDSANQGYDELEKKIMVLILAYDYSGFIPTIYPKSVDYFLKHTYRNITGESKSEIDLQEFFDAIQKKGTQLNNVFSETNLIEDLPNLLNFASKVSKNQVSISKLTELTGIPEETKMKEEELVQWLFHDFLLLKVLKQK